MGADYCFRIGTTHSICQDYALAGESKGITYAILSDGCSGITKLEQPGSPYTDFGARFIVLSALRNLSTIANSTEWSEEDQSFLIKNPPSKYLLKVIADADAIRRQASLPSDSLDATLLMVTETNGTISVVMAGDGVIAFRYRNGTIKYMRRSFEKGMPGYLNYHIKSQVQKDYFSQAKTFTEYYGEKINGTYIETSQTFPNTTIDLSYYNILLDKNEIDLVLLFSDGVESFVDSNNDPVSFDQILEIIIDLPRMSGQFITRSCNYLLKRYCIEKKWQHQDDFSCAGIYLP
jgi:hypothetical protein